ncbi:Uncharacterized protein TCM_022177 [Theobroma cacao]|uniref:Uncharacterized protein n=1 Tax=Theobroma cacao TaxID=3641 RepID=A0A061F013_THECC|nr:Uncharacterized protein TCM_022177 [Theobroma cacao]
MNLPLMPHDFTNRTSPQGTEVLGLAQGVRTPEYSKFFTVFDGIIIIAALQLTVRPILKWSKQPVLRALKYGSGA